MGIAHEVVASNVDECLISADHPRTFALRAAFAKANDVAARQGDGTWVLAADTVVTLRQVLYGKPVTTDEARRMLRQLSGETHEVITALALAQAGTKNTYLRSATTTVTFRALSDRDIEEYVATGEPSDKAGAYGIQGHGGDLIERIRGDYFNVVGLPCALLVEMLAEAGLELGAHVPAPPSRWT